jgi:hypothetical protein
MWSVRGKIRWYAGESYHDRAFGHARKLNDDQNTRPSSLTNLDGTAVHDEPAGKRIEGRLNLFHTLEDLSVRNNLP